MYWFLRPLLFGWLFVLGLYEEEHLHIFKCVSIDYTAFAVSGMAKIP